MTQDLPPLPPRVGYLVYSEGDMRTYAESALQSANERIAELQENREDGLAIIQALRLQIDRANERIAYLERNEGNAAFWMDKFSEAAKQRHDEMPALQAANERIADYEEVLADHRRLVRELDVLLNGEEGAAKQASLCDIVAQVAKRCRTQSGDTK